MADAQPLSPRAPLPQTLPVLGWVPSSGGGSTGELCLLPPAVGAAALSCSMQECCRLSWPSCPASSMGFSPPGSWAQDLSRYHTPLFSVQHPPCRAGTLLLGHGQLRGQSLALPWRCHLPRSCTAMNFAGVLVACWGAPSLVLSMGNSAPRPEPAAPRGRAGAAHRHGTPRLQVGAPPHPWALPAQTGPEPRCPRTSPSPATPPCPPAPVTAVPAARATWGCAAGVRRGLCWPTSAQMFLAVKGGPERGRLCCCCPGPDYALCPWRSPELPNLTGTAPSVNEAQADG